jgi:Domain of unknown function (DUF4434)/Domain of unknown function (DUF5109)
VSGPKRLICLAVASLATLAGPIAAAQATPCVAQPRFAGSFVQPWLPDGWDASQWSTEFSLMDNVCINQVVLQWTADSKAKQTWYPTALPGYTRVSVLDVPENLLSRADGDGYQVYLGLTINDDWWTKFAYDRTWLMNEMATADQVMDELWSRYGSHPSLAGWYLAFEPWNEATNGTVTQSQLQQNLADALAVVANHAHSTDGRKPLMISPFFNTSFGLSSTQWKSMWQQVLGTAALDTIALQDGVGAGHAQQSQLATWYDQTKQAIGAARPATKLWDDAETYVDDGSGNLSPMNVSQYVGDMQAVSPYVSNYLSFSFNHYISSQQVAPNYYADYEHWVETGTL